MLLNITNGEVACPFDEEDIVEVTELPLQYTDEYDTTYEVPLESQVFLQQDAKTGNFYRLNPVKGAKTVDAIATGEAAVIGEVHRKVTLPNNDEALNFLRDVFDRLFLFLSGSCSGVLALYAAYVYINLENGQRLASYCLRFDQALTILVLLTVVLSWERFAFFRQHLIKAIGNENGPNVLKYKSKTWISGSYFFSMLAVYICLLIGHKFASTLSANVESPTLDADYSTVEIVYVALQTGAAVFSFAGWIVISCFKSGSRASVDK